MSTQYAGHLRRCARCGHVTILPTKRVTCVCGASAPAISSGSFYNLARLSGVHRTHVSRVLRGLATAAPRTLLLIADAAGVDYAALVAHLEIKRLGINK